MGTRIWLQETVIKDRTEIWPCALLEMPRFEPPETRNLWRCVMHVPFPGARCIPTSSHLEVFSCQARKEEEEKKQPCFTLVESVNVC